MGTHDYPVVYYHHEDATEEQVALIDDFLDEELDQNKMWEVTQKIIEMANNERIDPSLVGIYTVIDSASDTDTDTDSSGTDTDSSGTDTDSSGTDGCNFHCCKNGICTDNTCQCHFIQFTSDTTSDEEKRSMQLHTGAECHHIRVTKTKYTDEVDVYYRRKISSGICVSMGNA